MLFAILLCIWSGFFIFFEKLVNILCTIHGFFKIGNNVRLVFQLKLNLNSKLCSDFNF